MQIAVDLREEDQARPRGEKKQLLGGHKGIDEIDLREPPDPKCFEKFSLFCFLNCFRNNLFVNYIVKCLVQKLN